MQSDIQEIARMIWETVFDLVLEPADDVELSEESTVTSFVLVDGEWQGAVMLQCPMVLAEALTVSMFDGNSDGCPTMSEADVRDAVGEVANMVAGNIKALLPEPCHISLPAVALGSDDAVSVPGTESMIAVPFTCHGQSLVITLLERRDDPKVAT
jgi:chemotaxis protein CheX